jgi:hypothetical protein
MMNIIWSWMLDLINQHELLELEERQKFLVYLITSISQHAELNWLMWYSVTRTIYVIVRFSMRIWNIYLCIYSTGTLLLAVASWPVDQKGSVWISLCRLTFFTLEFFSTTENTIKQPIDANLNHRPCSAGWLPASQQCFSLTPVQH